MDNMIKTVSAIILAIIVAINAFGNFIGIGDIIPTEPETTAVETTVPEETTTENNAAAIADFIAFYNAETAKIAANGSYSFSRNCEYTAPVDVGGATDVLNGIIGAIDENSNLDSVVGSFLGIGTKRGSYPEDYLDENYKLMAATLQAGDISDFSEENGVYKFTLPAAANPKKTGETPLSRFTNDFVTEEEVAKNIAYFTNAIKVTGSDGTIDNIKVEVTVVDGKITSIKYAYNMDATLKLKAIVIINAAVATRINAGYTNIAY